MMNNFINTSILDVGVWIGDGVGGGKPLPTRLWRDCSGAGENCALLFVFVFVCVCVRAYVYVRACVLYTYKGLMQ